MTQGIYHELCYPASPQDRPYIVMNMVTTIDGKIVTGDKNEPVQDLGSALDHATMRQIQNSVDGVLIGAGNLRSTPKMWYPDGLFRFVATRSGNLTPFHRFFTDAPDRAFAITAVDRASKISEEIQTIALGNPEIDWKALFLTMRHDMGIRALLIEGGSDLNADVLSQDVVDEVFLTIAPKIKLGESTPTLAGGHPLPREELLQYKMISCLPSENEVFLRYRRAHQ